MTHRSNAIPPSLETRDGGFILFSNNNYSCQHHLETHRTPFVSNVATTRPTAATPSPSLARNTRRREYMFLQLVPYPLPRSKHETEGVYFILFSSNQSPIPSLTRNTRRRGYILFYFPPTTTAANTTSSKQETEGRFLTKSALRLVLRHILFILF